MAEAYTVTKVNAYIRNMFQADFVLNRIAVKGEVSNCKYHSSGHLYFTLKDEGGTLSCVMFASHASGLSFRMKEGMRVVASGRIDVYERDGKYQLYVTAAHMAGTGDLFRRFQVLKEELEEMGMFAREYKKPIPRFAIQIGIVTAPTGAAVRDIMNIAARRNPYVQLYLAPALVQGAEAKDSIARAIRRLDEMNLDVLIVGRGGGSIEDLWAFNEESVARAIFQCRTPVISAVGHETDYTIADFVADMRAPTPSAAAELAVFDYAAWQRDLEQAKKRLCRNMRTLLDQRKERLARHLLRLEHRAPRQMLDEKRMYLASIEERLLRKMTDRIRDKRHELALVSRRLSGASPLATLARGYGYVATPQGENIRSVSQVSPGQPLEIHVKDGCVEAIASRVRKDRKPG